MSSCNYTQVINPQECIGDSLVKINNNFANLDNALCSIVNPVLSFRNKLINAQGLINQRVYSGGPTNGNNEYTLDRWRVVAGGETLAFSTTNNVTTFTAPANGVEQVIEGNNLESGSYTLSWTGAASAYINGSAITNGGVVYVAGGSNVTVKFANGTFSLPQFIKSPVTAPFEYRPFNFELELCKRYYEKGYDINVAPGSYDTAPSNNPALFRYHTYGAKNASNTYDYSFNIPFQTEKRTTPTVTVYSPYSLSPGPGPEEQFFLQSSPVNNIAGVVPNPNTKGFYTDGITLSIYANAYIQWTADAEIY